MLREYRVDGCLLPAVQRWSPTMVCAVTTPLHSQYTGSPNHVPRVAGRGPNLTYKVISPGRKTHFANNEIYYIYEKCVD